MASVMGRSPGEAVHSSGCSDPYPLSLGQIARQWPALPHHPLGWSHVVNARVQPRILQKEHPCTSISNQGMGPHPCPSSVPPQSPPRPPERATMLTPPLMSSPPPVNLSPTDVSLMVCCVGLRCCRCEGRGLGPVGLQGRRGRGGVPCGAPICLFPDPADICWCLSANSSHCGESGGASWFLFACPCSRVRCEVSVVLISKGLQCVLGVSGCQTGVAPGCVGVPSCGSLVLPLGHV